MSETERARVDVALELVRDALAPYVDVAMANALGPQWDELLADEDAMRRPNGRRQPVSKNDLAVLLKAIQYRRIAPWWNSSAYVDPRIRSYASELLTLRNMFAHGNDCVNEHARLVDTASRLLQMLDLPVPYELQPEIQVPTNDPRDGVAVAVPEQSPIAMDLFDSEVASLGESGDRVAQLLRRIQELPEILYRQALEDNAAAPGSPAADFVESELAKTVANTASKITGAEVLDLLDETQLLEAEADAHDSSVLKVLALFARLTLLDGAMGLLALSHAFDEILDRSASGAAPEEKREERSARVRAAADRIDQMKKWMDQGPVEHWREVVQLAHKLDDGSPIASSIVVIGSLELLDDPAIESDEALRLLRDSGAHARMLAGMDPGSQYETWVVLFLRREGKLCNDLGLPDEATRAFARADEIIDRYPTADPELVY